MIGYRRTQMAGVPLLAVTALLLAGCGAQPSPSATSPDPTDSTSPAAEITTEAPQPNDEACADFAMANNELASLLSDGKGSLTVPEWHVAQKNQLQALDKASLQAEGRVAERMEAAVELVPSLPLEMVLTDGWRTGDAYNLAISRVASACEAEGSSSMFNEMTLPPEMLRR